MALGGWEFHPPQSAERRKVPARHIAHRTRHALPCTLARFAHASTTSCRPRCRNYSTQACWPLKKRSCDEIATNEAAELCKRAQAPTPVIRAGVWAGTVVRVDWHTHLQCVDGLHIRHQRFLRLELDHLPAVQSGRR